MKAEIDYRTAWCEYRKLFRVLLLITISYVPVCFGVAYLSLKLFGSPIIGFVVGVLWLCAWVLCCFPFFQLALPSVRQAF